MPQFCISVKDFGGDVLFGASDDGITNYFHYGAPGQPDLGQNPGFVTVKGLLSNLNAVSTLVQTQSRSFLMAFVGHSDANVYIGASANATNWSTEKLSVTSLYTPSLLRAGESLYLLYVVDQAQNIVMHQSNNGKNWIGPNMSGQQTRAAPCVAQAPFAGSPPGYPNYAYIMAFVSNDDNYNLLVCTSQDGATWSQSPGVGQQSGFAPSLTFTPPNWPNPYNPDENQMVWIAFASLGTNSFISTGTTGGAFVYTVPATPGSYNVAPVDGEIFLSQSSDGYNWGPVIKTGHFTRAAPILRYIDGRLLLMFLGKDPNNPSIFACTSSDGVSWAEHQICPGVAPPAFGGFDFPPYFEAPVLKG